MIDIDIKVPSATRTQHPVDVTTTSTPTNVDGVVPGKQGERGPAGEITSATATALIPGADPTVTLGGTPSKRTLDFGIPESQPLPDTGWRRIEPIATDTAEALIDIRREGKHVYIRVTMSGSWAAGSASGPLMMYEGFNPDVYYHDNRYAGGVPILANIGNGLPTHRGWVGLLAHPTSRRVWINTTAAHGRLCNAIIQYPTADEWPEELPGEPVE